MDTVSMIMKYERGEMVLGEMIELFEELIKTGLIHELQGHYQRTARQLMRDGLLTISED
jgi:hypothetical protein